MTRLAIVEQGIVTKTIIGEEGFGSGIECPPEVGIGWHHVDDTWLPPDREPPSSPALEDYSAAVQGLLDAKARERQYENIQSAVSYRDDPNPRYAAEGQSLFEWRSAVWTYAETELAKVTSGQREAPGIDAFVSELPTFAWPG